MGAERSKPAAIAGRWEFPGGKAEPGETPAQALHRELREELGVAVELGTEIIGPDREPGGHIGWHITDRHVMRVWFARITDGAPRPLVEHTRLRWLPLAHLWTVPWLDGDIPIVRRIEDAFEDAAGVQPLPGDHAAR
ncbi:(deoxy)nucleoside triphosphate pyrophosphohydrolase [Rarobacter incanus]